VTLYSSPTARTLSTAAAMAPQMQVESVVPAYALNCCAAAKSHGVANAFPQEPPEAEKLRGVSLACWPPRGDPKEVDRRQKCGDSGFAQAVSELAVGHSAGEVVVLVTHREGIWELQHHFGKRMSGMMYCCIHYYSLDLCTGGMSSWQPQSPGPRRAVPGRLRAGSQTRAGSRPRPGSCSGGVQPRADAPVGELATLLQRGSGQVAVDCGEGARLWRTPGVVGVYVGTEPLLAGEELALLSEPQFSEGAEGEAFVRVARASGEQGWLRVADAALPAAPRP